MKRSKKFKKGFRHKRRTHVSFPYNRDMGERALEGVPNITTNPHLDRDELPIKPFVSPKYKNLNTASTGSIPKSSPELYRWFSEMAYQKDMQQVKEQAFKRGWYLDSTYSDEESKLFIHPELRIATLTFRGTVPTRWKDLKSDFAIVIGSEQTEERFERSLRKFDLVKNRLGHQYQIDVTGHSLGGSIASHVNRSRPGQVRETLMYSKGSSVPDLFRTEPENTWHYSHRFDPISLFARVSSGKTPKNMVDTRSSGPMVTHDIKKLSHLTKDLPSDYSVPHPQVETTAIDGIRIR